jgi:hypothetical protein
MTADPLATLRTLAARYEQARSQLAAAETARDNEIRALLAIKPPIPRDDIAAACNLTEQRLYQIRRRRRN